MTTNYHPKLLRYFKAFLAVKNYENETIPLIKDRTKYFYLLDKQEKEKLEQELTALPYWENLYSQVINSEIYQSQINLFSKDTNNGHKKLYDFLKKMNIVEPKRKVIPDSYKKADTEEKKEKVEKKKAKAQEVFDGIPFSPTNVKQNVEKVIQKQEDKKQKIEQKQDQLKEANNKTKEEIKQDIKPPVQKQVSTAPPVVLPKQIPTTIQQEVITEPKKSIINYSNLLYNTQLLEEDIFDPREIDYYLPKSYVNPIPAFMSVLSLSQTIDYSQLFNRNDNQRGNIDDPFRGGTIYNQFFLTQNIEIYTEKYQLEDTISEGFVTFFYGSAPMTWTFSGTLINDMFHNWHGKFRVLWENHIKGSVLVKNKSVLVLIIPSSNSIVEGYPISASLANDVGNEGMSTFSLTLVIRNVRTIPNIKISNPKGKTPIETSFKIAQILKKMKTQNIA